MSAQERLEKFHQLEPELQVFLEFFSLVLTPQTKKEILELFDGYLSSQGRTPRNLEWWIRELRKLRLLEYGSGRYYCSPLVIEEIAAHAATHGRASQMSQYIGEKLRHSVEKPDGRSKTEEVQTLEPIIDMLVMSINQATPVDDVILKSLWAHSSEPKAMDILLHQRLLRGEPIDDDTSHVEVLQEVLSGDLSRLRALSLRFCQEDGRRSFPFASQEFIYTVACYASGAVELVEERVRHGSRLTRSMMEWFWQIRTQGRTDIDPRLRREWSRFDYAPMMNFFRFLLLYWAGFPSAIDQKKLSEVAELYETAGYIVLSRELKSLGEFLSGGRGRLTPFLSLIEPTQHWRATLANIEGWLASAQTRHVGEAKEETEATQRLVWVLDCEATYFSLRAKIQKKNKRGGWTKGRRIELRDVGYRAARLLDDRDRSVLSAWSLAERFGSQPGRKLKVAEELVGHPRLFLPGGRALQLSRGAPTLLVSEEGEFVTLQVVPPMLRFQEFGFRELGPARYALVPFESATRKFVNILQSRGVTSPRSERERIQGLLSAISANGIQVQSCLSAEVETDRVEIAGPLIIRLYPQGDGLRVEVVVEPAGPEGPSLFPGHGARHWITTEAGKTVEKVRDFAQEMELYRALSEKIVSLTDFQAVCSGAEECLLLLEALKEFSSDNYSVQWPEGKKFQQSTVIDWSSVSLSLRKDRDWFAVQTQLEWSGDEQIELSHLLELHQQQKTRFVKLDEHRYVILTRTFERRLKRLRRAAHSEKDGTYRLNPLAAAILFEDVKSGDEAWQATRKRLAGARVSKPRVPKSLNAELRPYQREGYRWLARSAEWGVGVCLADDMGLGKTVQILALLLRRSKSGPALVVAPTSVCSNWKDEAQRFAPSLEPIMYAEADREKVLAALGPGDLVICSYGLLHRNLESFRSLVWSTLVLDESQAIKNSHTRRFKAAISLQSKFRVAATGTPVENHLSELWALFRFLNPGLLGPQYSFLRRYGSDPDDLQGLRNLIAPFLLRRLKKDVLRDLPPKTDITVKFELTAEEKLFYESLRLSAVARIKTKKEGLIGILAELMKLRRACCHPSLVDAQTTLTSSKMERCMELVETLGEGGHRVLVFSQFVDHLGLVRTELERRDVSYQYLDGSTPAKKRAIAVKEFQKGKGDVFLISLKAGGTGLNLTAANYVVHLDPWWNPATEDQASDRAHRIGQQQPVTVYRLIAQGTIEEKILDLHREKRELVDNLLAGSDRAGKLSADELLNLLRESTVSTS